jgi:hypothetical protein
VAVDKVWPVEARASGQVIAMPNCMIVIATRQSTGPKLRNL